MKRRTKPIPRPLRNKSAGGRPDGEVVIERIVSGKPGSGDSSLDLSLRPQHLTEFIGQARVKDNLDIAISAAKGRGEALDHVMLYGPPGLGKTTLGHIIAAEMGVSIRVTSGPAVQRAGDMAAILTGLKAGDVLFIDEIHRLGKVVEEMLYPAMEDRGMDIVIGKGPGAKSLRLSLPAFTLIGATTRFAMLGSPLRDRFGAVYRLDFYDTAAIEEILRRSARILGVAADDGGIAALAGRARGTPRVANRLLKRVRDYAEVKAGGVITREVALAAAERMEVDAIGLDETDHKVLRTIIEKFDGGPVGLDTIAACISEEPDTITDIYEPYLMQLGFLERTPRGRLATRLAYQHLAVPLKKGRGDQPTLWAAADDG